MSYSSNEVESFEQTTLHFLVLFVTSCQFLVFSSLWNAHILNDGDFMKNLLVIILV